MIPHFLGLQHDLQEIARHVEAACRVSFGLLALESDAVLFHVNVLIPLERENFTFSHPRVVANRGRHLDVIGSRISNAEVDLMLTKSFSHIIFGEPWEMGNKR